MPSTLRACRSHRERVSWDTPTVAANVFALTARGPINRWTTRAVHAAPYVCLRTHSRPPTGNRHGRCIRTAHATTILTQGVVGSPRLTLLSRLD
jgi:hypothetical protein